MKVNKTLKLNYGTEIPSIGLGVWDMPDGKSTENAVLWAIEAGYRHIDTAKIYYNETDVGNAIRKASMPRDELFITTKLWNDDHGYESALKAFDHSLNRLQMDYVDLYLIHWPFMGWGKTKVENASKMAETWKAMELIYKTGQAKAIGVSNFTIRHLEETKVSASVFPMVNQIEFHPFWYRKELMDYCQQNGIVATDYCPLIRGKKLFDEPITAIAKSYGKSNAQILIRWGLQHGNVVIPKSSHQERIIENISVFDIEIITKDMEKLDALNEDYNVVIS